MESLRSFVITLVTVLLFMSAVELMSPDNKMKKYIKFVLGLILMTVILNPIMEFLSKGEGSVINGINQYTQVFSQESRDISNEYNSILNGDENKDDKRKKSFIDNFNKNCESLLRNKFPDKQFESELNCNVDFAAVKLDINKLTIKVSDNNKGIKPIKKVVIPSEESTSAPDDKDLNEIKDYISSELKISKDKIDVYRVEE